MTENPTTPEGICERILAAKEPAFANIERMMEGRNLAITGILKGRDLEAEPLTEEEITTMHRHRINDIKAWVNGSISKLCDMVKKQGICSVDELAAVVATHWDQSIAALHEKGFPTEKEEKYTSEFTVVIGAISEALGINNRVVELYAQQKRAAAQESGQKRG